MSIRILDPRVRDRSGGGAHWSGVENSLPSFPRIVIGPNQVKSMIHLKVMLTSRRRSTDLRNSAGGMLPVERPGVPIGVVDSE